MFNEGLNKSVGMFSFLHIVTLAIILVMFVLFFIFKNVFTNNKKADVLFRYTLASILFIVESGYYIWVIVRGKATLSLLPFELCSIAIILTVIALFTDNKVIISITYYWSIVGVFFAIVFVQVDYTLPHFRFFHYFVSHIGFLLGNIYYVSTKRVKLTKITFVRSALILLATALVLWGMDIILKQNWMFMVDCPVSGVTPALGTPLYSIIWILCVLVFIGVVHFVTEFLFRVFGQTTKKIKD